MWPNVTTFTEEILNGKLHFLQCYPRSKQIMITAEYLLSHLNIEADNSKNKCKWKLHLALFDMIYQKWCTPTIGLLATQMHHQIPVYMAWKLDPGCLTTNAMQQPWAKMFPYAFS